MNAFCLGSFSEHFRSVDLFSEHSFGRIFLFLLNFGQGPIREYFIYKLVPDLQTFATFRSFVQIQWNQRPLLRYDPLYPDNQHKYCLKALKFEFKQICIWIRLIVTWVL